MGTVCSCLQTTRESVLAKNKSVTSDTLHHRNKQNKDSTDRNGLAYRKKSVGEVPLQRFFGPNGIGIVSSNDHIPSTAKSAEILDIGRPTEVEHGVHVEYNKENGKFMVRSALPRTFR
jgi:hypothetical protein